MEKFETMIDYCIEKTKSELVDSFFSDLNYEFAEKLETVVEKEISTHLTHQEKLDALKLYPTLFEYMSAEDKANIEIAKAAVFHKTVMYIYCSDEIRNNKQFVLDLATNGNIQFGDLDYFEKQFKSDKEIVFQIAKKDVEHAFSYSRNLEDYFKENLKGSKYDETCLTLLRNSILAEHLQKTVPVKKISTAPKMKI